MLISPYSVGAPDWAAHTLPVKISKEQVINSPTIESDKPVSRQYERSFLGYYGYPYYWGGPGLWGENSYPGTTLTGTAADPLPNYLGYLKVPSDNADEADPHLRSCGAIKGYRIHAIDGEIGHVQGFIVDDVTWSIRYLVINTSNWWVGHKVLVSPEWIEDLSWADSRVMIDLDKRSIQDAPPYLSDATLDRDAEVGIYRHYDRQGYWLHERNSTVA